MTSYSSNKMPPSLSSSKNNNYNNNNNNVSILLSTDRLTSFEQSLSYTSNILSNNDYVEKHPSNDSGNFWNSPASRGSIVKSINNNNNNNNLKRKRISNNSQEDKNLVKSGKRRIKHTPNNLHFVNGKEVVIPPEEIDINNYEIEQYNMNNNDIGGRKIVSLLPSKSPRKTKPLLINRNFFYEPDKKNPPLLNSSQKKYSQKKQGDNKTTSKTNRSKLRQLSGKDNITTTNSSALNFSATAATAQKKEDLHSYDPDYPEYNTYKNKLSNIRNKSALETFCQEQRNVLLETQNNLVKLQQSQKKQQKNQQKLQKPQQKQQQQKVTTHRKRGRPLAKPLQAKPVMPIKPTIPHSTTNVITTRRKSNFSKRLMATSSDLEIAPESNEESSRRKSNVAKPMSSDVENSTEKKEKVSTPIPARSQASRFPKDWLVEKRPTNKYYIRSPDGVEYSSLKEGLDALKIYKKNLLDSAKAEKVPNKVGITPKKTRPVRTRMHPPQQSQLIKQQHCDTLLTSLWLKDDSLKLLGSKPVWDDAFFVDENLKLLKNIVLRNRMYDNNGDCDNNNALLSSLLSWNISNEINGINSINSNGNQYVSVGDEPRPARAARKKRNRTSNNGAACPTDFHAHALVTPKEYGEVCPPTSIVRENEPPPQPFEVIIHPDVPFIADFHAHCAKVEIIGLLGGKWVPSTDPDTNSKLYVQACLPCVSSDDGSTDVEMDPASMAIAQEALNAHDLIIVGWYHSHPAFRANPSSTDLINQANFQSLFRDKKNKVSVANKNDVKGVVEPFVGLIIHPSDPTAEEEPYLQHQHYSQDEDDDNIDIGHTNTTDNKNRRLCQSELTWFHVHRSASTFSHRGYNLKNMGYMGVTLPEGQECVFAMALRTTMRIRKGSLLHGFYEKEKIKLPSDLQNLDESELLSKLQQSLQGNVQTRSPSKCNSPNETENHRNLHNHHNGMSMADDKDILSNLLYLRGKGFIGDRGLDKVKDAKLILPIISNNSEEKFDDLPHLMKLLNSQVLQSLEQMKGIDDNEMRYIQELLSNDSSSTSRSTITSNALISNLRRETITCLIGHLKDRGTLKNFRKEDQRIPLLCCEICGHTFDKKNELIEFRNHLAEHEERNEVPPLELFNYGSNMYDLSLDAMKQQALHHSFPKSMSLCNRFNGVYPIPGCLSFVSVLSRFDKNSEDKGDVHPVGVYNFDVEAALAYDFQERARAKINSFSDDAAAAAAAFLSALRHDHSSFNNKKNLSGKQVDDNIFATGNDKTTNLKKMLTKTSYNFSSSGERLFSKNPHVIQSRRIGKLRVSSYRGVSLENCRWRACCNNVFIGTFRTESEAARVINLINIRTKGKDALLNHVPLSVSKVIAIKEGIDMSCMTRPLYHWDNEDHVSTFNFISLQSKNDDPKLEKESTDNSKEEKEITVENKDTQSDTAHNLEKISDSSELQHLKQEEQSNNDDSYIELISKVEKAFSDAILKVNQRLGDVKAISHMCVMNFSKVENAQDDFNGGKYSNCMEQIEHTISATCVPRQISSICIFCNVCSEIVVNIDSLMAPFSESSKYLDRDYGIKLDSCTTSRIIEKIERHIVQPLHCLLASILQPVPSPSVSKNSECNGDIHCDGSLSKETPIRPMNSCVCLQPISGNALSTGPLLHCSVKAHCSGNVFHTECLNGENGHHTFNKAGNHSKPEDSHKLCRICASYEQKNGCIKFEASQQKNNKQAVDKDQTNSASLENVLSMQLSTNESNVAYFGNLHFPLVDLPSVKEKADTLTIDTLPSITCNPELIELSGIVSQIQCIIRYYCIWPDSRRTDFLFSSGSSTIDYCDIMRLAIAIHASKMIDFSAKALRGFDSFHDASLIDLICRLVRFNWIISEKKS